MYSRALCHHSSLSRTALPWLAALVALPLYAAAPTELVIGTGSLDGVYYPAGGAICRLLNEETQHGLHCTVQSSTGSLANLTALATGEVQLALVQSDILDHAAHGTGPFAGQPANEALRSLFRLHQESLTLIASENSGITALTDIEGKRVDLGSPDSGDRITTQALLDAMGWQAGSFAAPPVPPATHRLEGLCNGTLDAAFVVAGHPNQEIGDLTSRCKARLIPIEGEQVDQLLKRYPYYQRSQIRADFYPDQPVAIHTFAVTAELVAQDSLPPAEVRAVRDVLTTQLKQFTRLHPALTPLTLESIQAGTTVPLHPGMLDSPESALLPQPDALLPSVSASAPTSAASATDAASGAQTTATPEPAASAAATTLPTPTSAAGSTHVP